MTSAVAEPAAAPASTAARRIIVCAGTGCIATGALEVLEAFRREVVAAGLPVALTFADDGCGRVRVSGSGCQGFCQKGPLVTIAPDDILYTCVTPDDVPEIVRTTIVGGEIVKRLLYVDPATRKPCRNTSEIPFYRGQTRYVLANVGTIDPEDIDEYISIRGYEAARLAYTVLEPEAICDVVSRSGLRGRGGGGFPTGRKWETARRQNADQKYVICNGDEGDPGAFMDCGVMEGNPHSVVEGLMIAARAIGATRGYFYVRAEYPNAVRRLRRAVEDARARGFVGPNPFGSSYPIELEIVEGAGAFVCGEETAMIASIEGLRGMPSPKPPFPAQCGLWDKPTVINNVETLSQVPRILLDGADRYRERGTGSSPGTKTFALTGHVANTGLIEVPFGTTLREVVLGIGGGVTDESGRRWKDGFKAVQIGGPSGGCLTAEHLDLPLDFDSVKAAGAMIGSGGLVVMNGRTCMVQVARFFMEFTQSESCGKCVLCREGTRQILELLDDVIEGRATDATLPLLDQLGRAVQAGSLCGLGKSAPNPVLSTLKHFRTEYEEHVHGHLCRTGRCKALLKPSIDEGKCNGCHVCVPACPVGAISGERKKPHRIDPVLCTKCGTCADVCRVNAVVGV